MCRAKRRGRRRTEQKDVCTLCFREHRKLNESSNRCKLSVCANERRRDSPRVDRLVNKRDETIANDGAVSLPIVAVLFSARFTVASVAMDEENAEIYDVKVRNEVQIFHHQKPKCFYISYDKLLKKLGMPN